MVEAGAGDSRRRVRALRRSARRLAPAGRRCLRSGLAACFASQFLSDGFGENLQEFEQRPANTVLFVGEIDSWSNGELQPRVSYKWSTKKPCDEFVAGPK